jgi:hypothetical protein
MPGSKPKPLNTGHIESPSHTGSAIQHSPLPAAFSRYTLPPPATGEPSTQRCPARDSENHSPLFAAASPSISLQPSPLPADGSRFFAATPPQRSPSGRTGSSPTTQVVLPPPPALKREASFTPPNNPFFSTNRNSAEFREADDTAIAAAEAEVNAKAARAAAVEQTRAIHTARVAAPLKLVTVAHRRLTPTTGTEADARADATRAIAEAATIAAEKIKAAEIAEAAAEEKAKTAKAAAVKVDQKARAEAKIVAAKSRAVTETTLMTRRPAPETQAEYPTTKPLPAADNCCCPWRPKCLRS